MKKLYAAYGSNLNHAQMAYRCPDATVYGTAELKDHELLFRGSPTSAVATVEPKEGGSVPILLWEISKRDEHSLDRYEGWLSCSQANRIIAVSGTCIVISLPLVA